MSIVGVKNCKKRKESNERIKKSSKDVKDTVTKTIKVSKTKGITFKDFNFVVATFGEAIGNGNRERIEYAVRPINES